MKIKSGFVMRDVLGKTLVVPTGDAGEAVHGMIRLNATGKKIWNAVEAGKSVEEIADELVAEYDVDREKALADVNAFMEKMKEAGVFEE